MASPILQRVAQGLEDSETPQFLEEQPVHNKGTLHKPKELTPTAAQQGNEPNNNCHKQEKTLQPRHRDL